MCHTRNMQSHSGAFQSYFLARRQQLGKRLRVLSSEPGDPRVSLASGLPSKCFWCWSHRALPKETGTLPQSGAWDTAGSATRGHARTGSTPPAPTGSTPPRPHLAPHLAPSAGCFERPLYARHCPSYLGYSKEQSGITSLYLWSCQRDPRTPILCPFRRGSVLAMGRTPTPAQLPGSVLWVAPEMPSSQVSFFFKTWGR